MPSQKGRIITWGDKISKAKKGVPNYVQRRENNPRWKGDDIAYVHLHKWVSYNKGRPALCEFCGTTTAKKYEWASRDHGYTRDLNSYIRLCTSCHRKHDILVNGYKIKGKNVQQDRINKTS